MAEWSKAVDCKSAEFILHRFESYLSHGEFNNIFSKKIILDRGNSLIGQALVCQTKSCGFKSRFPRKDGIVQW